MRKVMLISPKDNNFYNFRSELILKLKDEGFDVVLVCPYGKKIDFFTEKGCRFIDTKVDRRGKSIINDYSLIKKYKSVLKHETPDVVLTYTTKPSVYAGYLCGKLGIPYIVNNAGIMEASGFFSYFMKLLYRIGFGRAEYVMCQNEYEKVFLSAILPKTMRFVRIPGSGVNLDYFKYSHYPTEDSGIVFNFVALIKKEKGISEYLRCAELIKLERPDTHFRIYGEYDSSEYAEVIEELQSRGIIEYMGAKLDIRPEIVSCHALIHPSYYEGMTNAVLEHSAMGRPCLGSDIPGVREGIEPGKTGFLFEAKNVKSMVNDVEQFLGLSYEEKKQMGIEARKKMEKEFNRNIVTIVYLEVITSILNKEKSSK